MIREDDRAGGKERLGRVENEMIDEQLGQVAAITRRLQRALRSGDLDSIARCYDANAEYSDPVLGGLGAGSARRAWSLILPLLRDPCWHFSVVDVGLCSSRSRSRLEFLFAPTARPVVLDISTVLCIRDGRIVRHDDEFSLSDWAKALPFPECLWARSRCFRHTGRFRTSTGFRLPAFIAAAAFLP